MATIKVHRFAVWDHAGGAMATSSRMATREAIERLKIAGIVGGTETEIDSVLLDGNGMTDRYFTPSLERI